ncbi:hypothetical protein SAMN04490356_4348 [Streptomyces melanosporofaciens]|uniref:Uncharacterized protein n=1 Tax=Streptomyces melanosporofaciens TaxID=67327 RepID=A0A1H4SYH8_STRMJ|nr:hypothetical protein SAMN04490356_4348 [Streptomyces melanosporofaciens]
MPARVISRTPPPTRRAAVRCLRRPVRPVPGRVWTPRRRPRRPGPVPPALRPGGTYRRNWSRSSAPTAPVAARSRPALPALLALPVRPVVGRRRLRRVRPARPVVGCMPPRRCSRVVRVCPARRRPRAPRSRLVPLVRPAPLVHPGSLVPGRRPLVRTVVGRRRLRRVRPARPAAGCTLPRRCSPAVVRPRPPELRARARVPHPARSRPAHPVSPVRVVRRRRRPRRARAGRRIRVDRARRALPVCLRPPVPRFRAWPRRRVCPLPAHPRRAHLLQGCPPRARPLPARPCRVWGPSPAMRIRRRPPVSRPWVRAIWRCCATARRTVRSSS